MFCFKPYFYTDPEPEIGGRPAAPPEAEDAEAEEKKEREAVGEEVETTQTTRQELQVEQEKIIKDELEKMSQIFDNVARESMELTLQKEYHMTEAAFDQFVQANPEMAEALLRGLVFRSMGPMEKLMQQHDDQFEGVFHRLFNGRNWEKGWNNLTEPFIKGHENNLGRIWRSENPVKGTAQRALGAGVGFFTVKFLGTLMRHSAFGNAEWHHAYNPTKGGLFNQTLAYGMAAEAMGYPVLQTLGKGVVGTAKGIEWVADGGVDFLNDALSGRSPNVLGFELGEQFTNGVNYMAGETEPEDYDEVNRIRSAEAFTEMEHQIRYFPLDLQPMCRRILESQNDEGQFRDTISEEVILSTTISSSVTGGISQQKGLTSRPTLPEENRDEMVRKAAEYCYYSHEVLMNTQESVEFLNRMFARQIHEGEVQRYMHSAAHSMLLNFFMTSENYGEQFRTEYARVKAEHKVDGSPQQKMLGLQEFYVDIYGDKVDIQDPEQAKFLGKQLTKVYKIDYRDQGPGMRVDESLIHEQMGQLHDNLKKDEKILGIFKPSQGFSGAILKLYGMATMGAWLFGAVSKRFFNLDARSRGEIPDRASNDGKTLDTKKLWAASGIAFSKLPGKEGTLDLGSNAERKQKAFLESLVTNKVFSPFVQVTKKGGLVVQPRAGITKKRTEVTPNTGAIHIEPEWIREIAFTRTQKFINNPSVEFKLLRENFLADIKDSYDKVPSAKATLEQFVDNQSHYFNRRNDVLGLYNSLEKTKKSVKITMQVQAYQRGGNLDLLDPDKKLARKKENGLETATITMVANKKGFTTHNVTEMGELFNRMDSRKALRSRGVQGRFSLTGKVDQFASPRSRKIPSETFQLSTDDKGELVIVKKVKTNEKRRFGLGKKNEVTPIARITQITSQPLES